MGIDAKQSRIDKGKNQIASSEKEKKIIQRKLKGKLKIQEKHKMRESVKRLKFMKGKPPNAKEGEK